MSSTIWNWNFCWKLTKENGKLKIKLSYYQTTENWKTIKKNEVGSVGNIFLL